MLCGVLIVGGFVGQAVCYHRTVHVSPKVVGVTFISSVYVCTFELASSLQCTVTRE